MTVFKSAFVRAIRARRVLLCVGQLEVYERFRSTHHTLGASQAPRDVNVHIHDDKRGRRKESEAAGCEVAAEVEADSTLTSARTRGVVRFRDPRVGDEREGE